MLAAGAALLGAWLSRPLLGAVLAGAAAAAMTAWLRSAGARSSDAAGRAASHRLLEGMPTAILLFSASRLVYANPVARQLFGLEGIEGDSAPKVLGDEGLAGAVTESEETGRTTVVEVERAGRELVGRASTTAAGEVVLVVTDLTEAKRVEAVRRDFVTNASHELKTPVASIQALSDSLQLALDRDPVRTRQMVRRLQEEAARLAQLVRELLDLSLLEEGAFGPERQLVDLAELVRTHLDRSARLAAERSVALRCDCAEPAALVSTPAEARLIVSNLIDNAIQYNRPGGEVAVKVRRRGGEVVLEVADTGIGIPEAEQGRVFERFYRVDKARSREAGGTGLGLSIVRNAVQRHGGRISVTSTPGEGSTFRVVLPVEGTPSHA